ncbi:SWAP/Surp superfamily [Arabidopsis suecica]|uniref:SWAP/Surp superfamily n=1 Tax=Arabidopsis suecica TaxID=45249 RepID=A0A8T1ZUW7_ARASU|nr:SWAP/Surp superfamily [Arabidopsis suecica]
MSSSRQMDSQTISDKAEAERIVKNVARCIARKGLKYEKRMMTNVKDPRINFLRNPEDPLHGYYKQKLSDYLSQLQKTGTIVDDFGHVAATNVSTQVTEPPPGFIRNDIENMARYISKGGLVFESVMRHLVADEARYIFMASSHPFHAFYQQKLTEYRSMNQQDGANLDYDATLAAYKQKATEFRSRIQQEGANLDDDADIGQRIVLPYGLDYRLPKGMNIKEFRTMKLTAQFGAWYGNDFWLGFKNRDGFEFTNPTDSKFPRFTRFVLEYSEVFNPPEDLKEKVSKSHAYMSAIHDGFFRLVNQWDSLQDLKWHDGGVMSMVRWHASLVKDFANNEELPHPETTGSVSGTEPEPKRLKLDESGLVPEDQFLAQHPGWCTIRVSIVSVEGREVNIIEKTVQSLSENVASFKEKIAEEVRSIPPEKQVLFGKAGLLKDNNRSLAHYNVGAGEILTLSLCTCGRETDLDKPCCCTELFNNALGEIMRSQASCFD